MSKKIAKTENDRALVIEETQAEPIPVVEGELAEKTSAKTAIATGVEWVKDEILGKLTGHGFVGSSLFVRADHLLKKSTKVDEVRTLLAMAGQIAKKDTQKAGQILLDIVLNTTHSHASQNQHAGLQPTVRERMQAYQLLVEYDCPQKNRAYFGMVYGVGTFTSAKEILDAADQIDSMTGAGHPMGRAVFLEESLYSLAVMSLADAAKLRIPAENLTQAALTLCEVEKTFTETEKARLPNHCQGHSARYYAGLEMQRAMSAATTLDEKIHYAALYAKVGYVIGDGDYVSPSFAADMQPLERAAVLKWDVMDAKGFWARLFFNDLKVQTFANTAQIDSLCQTFAAQGFQTNEMQADCLVLLAKNADAPMEQRQMAMDSLFASGSTRYDIKAILAEVTQNYENSCWDVIELYLKSNPELRQGYVSQFSGESHGAEAWGQFIASLQDLGLMGAEVDANLVYYAIESATANTGKAKEELLYLAAIDQNNDMTDRFQCCQKLHALESEFDFQASLILEQNINSRRREIREQITAALPFVESATPAEREALGLLREEDRALCALLTPAPPMDFKS